MNIKHEILSLAGRKPKCRRVGRGSASGFGRTAGRGHEGQRSRGNIAVSYMLKQALKVRKIRKVAGINTILYPTHVITMNSLPIDLVELITKASNSIEALQVICKYYGIEYNTETLANDLMYVFNIPFYNKRIKFIGCGLNNILLKI